MSLPRRLGRVGVKREAATPPAPVSDHDGFRLLFPRSFDQMAHDLREMGKNALVVGSSFVCHVVNDPETPDDPYWITPSMLAAVPSGTHVATHFGMVTHVHGDGWLSVLMTDEEGDSRALSRFPADFCFSIPRFQVGDPGDEMEAVLPIQDTALFREVEDLVTQRVSQDMERMILGELTPQEFVQGTVQTSASALTEQALRQTLSDMSLFGMDLAREGVMSLLRPSSLTVEAPRMNLNPNDPEGRDARPIRNIQFGVRELRPSLTRNSDIS